MTHMLKGRGDRLSPWRTPFWTMTGLVTKPFVAIELQKSWYMLSISSSICDGMLRKHNTDLISS